MSGQHLLAGEKSKDGWARPRKSASPFRYFNSSPEIIRLVVMMYVWFGTLALSGQLGPA